MSRKDFIVEPPELNPTRFIIEGSQPPAGRMASEAAGSGIAGGIANPDGSGAEIGCPSAQVRDGRSPATVPILSTRHQLQIPNLEASTLYVPYFMRSNL